MGGMSGMGGPLTTGNSMIVSAFQSSLLHQLLLVLVLLAALAIAWNVLRGAQLRHAIAARESGQDFSEHTSVPTESAARQLLRVGFGLIWIFDGLLQAQSAMPVGLATQVLSPGASSSPGWVQSFVNAGATIWNNHPITAAVSAVWIQVGIGIWLIVARRGRWSQVGALVAVGWGLVVWSFGEAFGQIFAPGLTILFGAPGAVLFYCLGGAMVALPERVWSSPRTGRYLLFGMGLFFCGMAVLQAWPGRGFWQGTVRNKPTGTLVGMVQSMAGTPQPGFLSGWVSGFANFDAAHGFAVNLFVVIVLGIIGVSLCSGRPQLARAGMILGSVFCLADWVLIEDFGFFGGLGTDPNSMIPIMVCCIAGYLAFVRPTALATEPLASTDASPLGFRERAKLDPSYAFRCLAAGGAALVTLLGVAPMALASTNANADAIVSEATNGTPQATNAPAPEFSLTDQHGRPVTLASLRGKTIALTFLDPVCTTECPIIGQEFRAADLALGARAKNTVFVAIVANQIYRSSFYTNAFDREENLSGVSNWLYLTGNLTELNRVWDNYGVQVSVSPAGAMIDHSDIAYIIDASGHERFILSDGPGAGTSVTMSSFSGLLDEKMAQLLGSTS